MAVKPSFGESCVEKRMPTRGSSQDRVSVKRWRGGRGRSDGQLVFEVPVSQAGEPDVGRGGKSPLRRDILLRGLQGRQPVQKGEKERKQKKDTDRLFHEHHSRWKDRNPWAHKKPGPWTDPGSRIIFRNPLYTFQVVLYTIFFYLAEHRFRQQTPDSGAFRTNTSARHVPPG